MTPARGAAPGLFEQSWPTFLKQPLIRPDAEAYRYVEGHLFGRVLMEP